MQTLKKLVDKLLGVKILYEGNSEFGSLKVYKEQGTINLTFDNKYIQSSYRPGKTPTGSVWDYFLIGPLFAPSPNEIKTVCILGLGAGTAVKLLNQPYKIGRIVGVEIDKKVVTLGIKYFDLNDNNLEIVIKDASKYIKETQEIFDFILVDTFFGDKIDPICSNLKFYADIKKHLSKEGLVLVNRVNTKKQSEINQKFLQEFPKLFAQCYALKVRKNTFYFGLEKPQKNEEILKRIQNSAANNKFLSFLKKLDKNNLIQLW